MSPRRLLRAFTAAVLSLSPARTAIAALPADSTPGTGTLVAGGLLGAVAGIALGAAIGNRIDDRRGVDRNCTTCTLWGRAIGGGVGSMLGISLGVHAFNGRRGRLAPVLLRTSGTIAAFMAASYGANRAGWDGVDDLAMLIGFGAGVYMAVRTERATMPAVTVALTFR